MFQQSIDGEENKVNELAPQELAPQELAPQEISPGELPDLPEEVGQVMDYESAYLIKDEEKNLMILSCGYLPPDAPEVVKRLRGSVYDLSLRLVMPSLPVAEEFAFGREYRSNLDNSVVPDNAIAREDQKRIEEFLNNQDTRVFIAKEGTLLRMFYHNDSWHLITHRKLNAFKSKWGSKMSFGEIFDKALEHDCRYRNLCHTIRHYLNPEAFDSPFPYYTALCIALDKSKKYMFFLRNTSENRIFSKAPATGRPHVYLVGHTDDDGNIHLASELNDSDIALDIIPEVRKDELHTYQDVVNSIRNYDPRIVQGYLMLNPVLNKAMKVIFPEIKEAYDLRDNQPSVMFRWLELFSDPSKQHRFTQLYPEYSEQFRDAYDKFEQAVRFIHNKYIQRYIKKEHTVIAPHLWQVMKRCGDWYMIHRTENCIVTRDVVKRILYEQEATLLNQILKKPIA